MSWIHSIRAPYWTVPNSGLRYAMLRECKNRISEYKGQYTLAAVSQRTSIMISTIKKLESGEMQIHDKLIESLIADLRMTKEEFLTMTKPIESALQAETVKVPVIAEGAASNKIDCPTKNTTDVASATVKRKRRTKAEMEAARAASTPTSTAPVVTPGQIARTILDTVPTPITKAILEGTEKVFTFVNHTSDSFFIRVEGTTIHILEMTAANKNKGTFVPNADDMAGTLIARTTKVKAGADK